MALSTSTLHTRWHHYFDNLNFSSMEFYALVEEAIRRRKLNDIEISSVSPGKEEGSSGLPANREYMRVTFNEYIFDICAAAFGNGFFISWWFTETGAYRRLFKIKKTHFQLDTDTMFQECIRACVHEAIDWLITTKGLRPLTPQEYISREF